MAMELRKTALSALCQDSWIEKNRLLGAVLPDTLVDPIRILVPQCGIPGRPALNMVPPSQLKQRSVHSSEGRAVLIHALAHIEFNAINLALDVVWRFANMPEAFDREWMVVAQEESLHFDLLNIHLQSLGYQYGDFPTHDGLWDMAERTKADPLARLALVPRTLEARCLDASPLVRHKLASGGDPRGAAIIDIILRDEIGHVATGNYWYRWLCMQRGLEPLATFSMLARAHGAPVLKGPFNLIARRAAGFDDEELDALGRPY